MTVAELEEMAWKLDGLRTVVRAPSWATIAVPYQKANAADKGMNITDYTKKRIKPCIGDYEVVVITGDGKIVHGRTLVGKARDSYT